jgi:hypothetical protein
MKPNPLLPRIKGHWWVIATPDGDCHRELLESEEVAQVLLPGIQRRHPGATIIRVRLMGTRRPPGRIKRKAVSFWRLGRPALANKASLPPLTLGIVPQTTRHH